ncbi:hypothetical protein M2192_008728 [Bradyrhizobium elkanii USDA 61]|jgi:hypothetical protein|uniref:Uncharacterized protein n=1 Tax=Bradyrhizobium elkanii TaxID=29448 RepID=A0A8I1Y8R2_BRAEL|nr:hypothetical protein [Bradyrhizobium elkanii]MCS4011768.1 hypothetical protein [Bradyrhizobium elkanii USDA 61]MCP1924764.1 hypothetical protein [Bradyrhizobium elkanii]MCS3477746.1 hypothetical protein [Bradyrhizobium elkanii]MCS3584480.1 hypothetical protein [Bradyrhizobium elkanii]
MIRLCAALVAALVSTGDAKFRARRLQELLQTAPQRTM